MRPVPCLWIFLGLLLLIAPAGADELKPEAGRKLIPEFSYCVAYVLREPTLGEVHGKRIDRPYDYLSLHASPVNSSQLYPPDCGIAVSGPQIINVAALAACVTAQARLSPEQAERVIAASSIADGPRFPLTDVYRPQHAFVFYTQMGKPVGCIELCFLSNHWRVNAGPEGRATGVDSAGLAKIMGELNLPIPPYGTFAEYQVAKKLELEVEVRREEEAKEGVEWIRRHMEEQIVKLEKDGVTDREAGIIEALRERLDRSKGKSPRIPDAGGESP